MGLDRPAALWALFALQAFCATFFAFDATADLLGYENQAGFRNTDYFEALVTIALFIGLALIWRRLRDVLARQKRLTAQIDIARGAFAEVLESHFQSWELTDSEREVALLSIKGFSVADMARLRETKEGTIKAQSAAVYRKAGVSGRLQLLSLFIEELVADRLIAEGEVPAG